MRRSLYLFCVLLLFAPAFGAERIPLLPAGLVAGESAVVAEASDGDSVRLGDGREVRLVGIQAPKLAKGRSGFMEWPLSHEAQKALTALVEKQTVTLHYGASRADRYGRVLAHLTRGDGLWVEGELLRQGMARVYTFPDNRALAPEMYALEREARDAKRGLWADPYYAIRKPTEVSQYVGQFELVEGRIEDGAKTAGGVFLNFGRDWHTAFTLRLHGDALKLFRDAGIDPLSLKGKSVRVRGYIKRDRDRAVMDITHPEEIEIL